MQRSHALLWLFGHLLALSVFASHYVYANPNEKNNKVCVIKEADVDSTGYAAGYYMSKIQSPKDMIDQIQQRSQPKGFCKMLNNKTFVITPGNKYARYSHFSTTHYESVPLSYFDKNWMDSVTLSKINPNQKVIYKNMS